MFQFGGAWNFVWGAKPQSPPVATGLGPHEDFSKIFPWRGQKWWNFYFTTRN